MTVLDAYAVIAFLRGEAATDDVDRVLKSGAAVLTAVGVAEVIDHLIRVAGIDEEDAALDVTQLGLLEGYPIGADLGLAAGRLRARRYDRSRCAVSMADCVAAEAARELDRPLVTADPHLLDVCQQERIPFVALPGTDGSTWTPEP